MLSDDNRKLLNNNRRASSLNPLVEGEGEKRDGWGKTSPQAPRLEKRRGGERMTVGVYL